MADTDENQTGNDQKIEMAQPGSVISPSGVAPAQTPAAPAIAQPVADPVQPVAQTIPEPEPPANQEVEPEPTQVSTGLEPAPAPHELNSDDEIVWVASEFVAHEKSAGWYLGLAVAAALIAAVAFFVTRDYVSVGVVFFAAVVFGFYGAHKPRQLQYRLNTRGIDIDKKHYSFSTFRTFSVIPEGAFSSIVLMPLKRFAPPLSIYFAPEDEDRIINLLMACLPFEERRRDAVDSLMHRIRF